MEILRTVSALLCCIVANSWSQNCKQNWTPKQLPFLPKWKEQASKQASNGTASTQSNSCFVSNPKSLMQFFLFDKRIHVRCRCWIAGHCTNFAKGQTWRQMEFILESYWKPLCVAYLFRFSHFHWWKVVICSNAVNTKVSNTMSFFVFWAIYFCLFLAEICINLASVFRVKSGSVCRSWLVDQSAIKAAVRMYHSDSFCWRQQLDNCTSVHRKNTAKVPGTCTWRFIYIVCLRMQCAGDAGSGNRKVSRQCHTGNAGTFYWCIDAVS